ncbi:MAG: capsular polysaccharide biosynthesis protein Cps4F [Bacillota bacterium]|jgi:glycosyltransferase involved in cell wall biosynthesis|nr:capsular polysaccharide biosynthesis protein Cps4F [Bacillota bacterium]
MEWRYDEMKLLVISQYFYPEQFRISDVCFRLASMGNDVTVLTGLPNYPAGEVFDGYQWEGLKGREIEAQSKYKSPEKKSGEESKGSYLPDLNAYQEEIHGVRVLRSKLSPRKSGKKNLAINYLSFAISATKVANAMLRKHSCDFDKIIVFQYSPVTMAVPGIFLKKKLGRPLVLYCFDLWPESIVSAGLPNHGFIYACILKLSRWIYRHADTLLISSKNFRKYFNDKLLLTENIHYLPIYAEDLFSAVSTDKRSSNNSSSSKDSSNNSSSDMTNLVFAGNLGEMQSLETIIKAANHVKLDKRIHFHIVGDGSALSRSKELAQDLALENITFHGRHPLEDMPRFYDMADAFLVTLKKDEFISYTLPGKVQSYMASGKPILAAIDGETADVIREAGCGLCCAAEDDKGLADLILHFSEDKENRRKYGDCAKAYYQANFSSDAFFQTFLSFLE